MTTKKESAPPSDSCKFRTTVDLSIPFEDNVYQFLYGSQLYGTLFAVYGMFDCDPFMNNTTKINTIIFRLINYRGNVNMGLLNEGDYKPKRRVDKEGRNSIELFVKPLLSSVDPVHFTFNGKGLEVKNGQQLTFQRLAVPWDERLDSKTETGKSQEKIFFDSEFNYRDGFYQEPEKPRDGHFDKKEHGIASPRCHYSCVSLKF